ncbi:hypothetical protein LY11_03139 [Pedobacter cryoconitis]|uniref:Uncharacterized protein n=1 Tax=Pedobacter cryoconitis TaxID=188932 RepID=A0A327SK21_9SPHI|nr:hypothetical protein LY11_03139 [Pedobacter cryoconitis]
MPIASFGQKISSSPFRGAGKIIINTSLSAKEGYLKAANMLLDSGYEISAKDNDLFFIESKDFEIEDTVPYGATVIKGKSKVRINVRAKDGELIVILKIRHENNSYGTVHYLIDPPRPLIFDIISDFSNKFKMPFSYSE